MGNCLIISKNKPLIDNILTDIKGTVNAVGYPEPSGYYNSIIVYGATSQSYTLPRNSYLYCAIRSGSDGGSESYISINGKKIFRAVKAGTNGWSVSNIRSYTYATKGSVVVVQGSINASNMKCECYFYDSKSGRLI